MKQRKLIFHFTQSQVNILMIEIRKKKGAITKQQCGRKTCANKHKGCN